MGARRSVSRFLTVILVLAAFGKISDAQTNFLSRSITLDIPSCSLETALTEISKAGDFRFAYDANMINAGRKVSVRVVNTPVHAVLKELIGKDFRTREIGSHVIIIRNPKRENEPAKVPEVVVSGKVIDGAIRTPIENATVYEIGRRKSAITTANGNFRLVIPSAGKRIGLTITKAGYRDTVVFLRNSAEEKADVLLQPLNGGLERMNSLQRNTLNYPTDSIAVVTWLVPYETMVNAQNLEVRTSRLFQASFIPYIGTNWKITGSITNRFSLNVLAGYTGGLDGVEVGGLLNVTRNNINGLQIGGLGNIVGGAGHGCQIGGLFNFDPGKFDGTQVAGLVNYAKDTVRGVQVSGLTGIVTGGISGVQVSGLASVITRNSDAWQVSGLVNVVRNDAKYAQVAGLVNFTDNLDGVQVAGLMNLTRRVSSGCQIAGIFNYTTILRGFQLGLVNVSNSVERGLPFGLFTYVEEGYHLFEVSGNEIFYGNIAFKSGVRSLYNFIQFGIGSDYKLQGSYGIGSNIRLTNKLSLSLDASAGFVYHPVDTVYHGLLLKFLPAMEYRFAKHFAIFGGPAYNFFLFPKGDPSATSRGLSTYDFYFKSTENASIQMWIGGVFGFRF